MSSPYVSVLATQNGLADSVVAGGIATAPGAGAAIATTAAVGTPGVYEVTVTCGTGVAGAAADVGNMQLNKTGAGFLKLSNPANGSVTTITIRMTLAATDTLSVVAVGAGTAAVVYTATIVARRIG